MTFANRIQTVSITDGEIAIFWLGQAGFVIKDSVGHTVTIDPYLTDCCERVFGFKRLSPKLITPSEMKTDVLFSTHDHLDHFDVDALPIIMANKATRFVGAKPSAVEYRKLGLDESRLIEIDEGETVDLGWVRFTGMYADHGDLAPKAIGVLVRIGGVTIYYTGDTAYRPDKMGVAIAANPDIIILPINGAYGNLNSKEAAKLVRDTKAKMAIPCHYWTFAVHGGDPQTFEDAMKRIAPDSRAEIMAQGEMITYCRG